MNTNEQHVRACANKKSKEIVKDSDAYVESVGRHDIDTLAVDTTLGATAIRLVFGGTTMMPYRALSYIESAARIAGHFPDAQLQIVHAHHVANHVNGIDLRKSRQAAEALMPYTAELYQKLPELEGRVVHAFDTPHDCDDYLDAAKDVLERTTQMATRLNTKGVRHGGDTARYVAAHFAFHDTDDVALDTMSGEQRTVDSIISVGCQQERKFYMARMAMRAFLEPRVATAQIFTEHLTPPYYLAQGGEPLLADGPDPSLMTDTAATRDIMYYLNLNNGKML